MTKKDSSTAYIPGVCNINHAEIEYRRKTGLTGFGLALAIVATMFSFNAPWWGSLAAFPLFFVGVIGYLQAKSKFCVSYGVSGKQNATEGHEGALEVSDAEAKKADVARARTLNMQASAVALGIALAFAGLAYLLR